MLTRSQVRIINYKGLIQHDPVIEAIKVMTGSCMYSMDEILFESQFRVFYDDKVENVLGSLALKQSCTARTAGVESGTQSGYGQVSDSKTVLGVARYLTI
jgi:hypothetical protein